MKQIGAWRKEQTPPWTCIIESPTKNLFLRRTEKCPERHEDTVLPCAGISSFMSKRAKLKLGRFSISFAEITNEMSLESTPVKCGESFQRVIYITCRKSQACFSFFSELFIRETD